MWKNLWFRRLLFFFLLMLTNYKNVMHPTEKNKLKYSFFDPNQRCKILMNSSLPAYSCGHSSLGRWSVLTVCWGWGPARPTRHRRRVDSSLNWFLFRIWILIDSSWIFYAAIIWLRFLLFWIYCKSNCLKKKTLQQCNHSR